MGGEELYKIRKKLDWTQAELAEKVGVTMTTLARWERNEVGISEPAARLIKILAQQKKGR